MFVRVLPAIGLFFLAPLVAEFLLGDFPITMIAILFFMAPMYGGGAILIREFTRRTGRGWPTIVTLALAYGILEEAFTTQSLFNPNYLGLNLHLLKPAFIPALGISAWWTVFVLTLHTVWSISVPIALTESLVPRRAEQPWLGRIGLTLIGALFVLAAIFMSFDAVRRDRIHFMASHAQFAIAAILCVAIAIIAFFVPKRIEPTTPRNSPNPWLSGGIALAAGSIFLLVPPTFGWAAVTIYIWLYAAVIALILMWSKTSAWDQLHVLSLAGGAALAYAWHAFLAKPVMGPSGFPMRAGNTVLALFTIMLIAVASRRIAATKTTKATDISALSA